jgi:hypothetical protein
MRRLLGSSVLGVGLVGLGLLYSKTAEARPNLEVTTTLGGADASEYLIRIENPDAIESSGDLELQRLGDNRVVGAHAPFSVPAKSTRYFRIPGEKGARFDAVAITSDGNIHAQDRYSVEGGQVLFDIPPRDAQRLHELRVHSTKQNIVVTHAAFDETTQTPILTKRPAVYDSVAVVMIPSSVFVALPAAEREALTTWVRAGGAIAMSFGPNERFEDIIGGEHLRSREFGSIADLGLGHVYILPLDPWSAKDNGDSDVQEKLAHIAENERRRSMGHFFGEPWADIPSPTLDPNRNYRSVMALAGILLVAQALISAFMFRRLATKRGMGPAYRFVVASSATTFAAVVGLGIYAKGGFSPRARELSFADAASGESVAWVERKRTYFASSARTVAVTPRDPSSDLHVRDAHAVYRADDGTLEGVTVRPWETTAVTERGTTTLGGGVKLETKGGTVVIRNATGNTLRNVVVSTPDHHCLGFGEIENGGTATGGTPISCVNLGPAWSEYEGAYSIRLEHYITEGQLVLLGQFEEAPGTIDGFRLEKRTTVVRVMGGDS